MRTDEWSPDHDKIAYDPLQGPAYHLSKTKDFVSGQRIKRLEKVFDTIPVDLSLHCDAWRDINLSYENTTEDDPWCVQPWWLVVSPCACQHSMREVHFTKTKHQTDRQHACLGRLVFVRSCRVPQATLTTST